MSPTMDKAIDTLGEEIREYRLGSQGLNQVPHHGSASLCGLRSHSRVVQTRGKAASSPWPSTCFSMACELRVVFTLELAAQKPKEE